MRCGFALGCGRPGGGAGDGQRAGPAGGAADRRGRHGAALRRHRRRGRDRRLVPVQWRRPGDRGRRRDRGPTWSRVLSGAHGAADPVRDRRHRRHADRHRTRRRERRPDPADVHRRRAQHGELRAVRHDRGAGPGHDPGIGRPPPAAAVAASHALHRAGDRLLGRGQRPVPHPHDDRHQRLRRDRLADGIPRRDDLDDTRARAVQRRRQGLRPHSARPREPRPRARDARVPRRTGHASVRRTGWWIPSNGTAERRGLVRAPRGPPRGRRGRARRRAAGRHAGRQAVRHQRATS